MTTDRTPIANITPFGLRMQPALKAEIEKLARDNNRSLNAEIVDRLEKSLEYDPTERGKYILMREILDELRMADFELSKIPTDQLEEELKVRSMASPRVRP